MIEFINLSKHYMSAEKHTVGITGLTTSFYSNDFVVVSGSSGSGKTTLLNIISGIDKPSDGEFIICNQSTDYFGEKDFDNYRKNYVSFVQQDYNLIESQSVFDNVKWSVDLNAIKGSTKREKRVIIITLLEKVGLSDKAFQKVKLLSAGERQRVAIARALGKDCPIILFDEPTGNLDVINAKAIVELINEISKDKLTVVSTHNPELFLKHASRHIELQRGLVVKDHLFRASDVELLKDPRAYFKDEVPLKNMFFNNIFNQPKRGLTMIFSFFFVSIITLILSSVLFHINDQNNLERVEDSMFSNFDKQRLIVSKFDNMP